MITIVKERFGLYYGMEASEGMVFVQIFQYKSFYVYLL